MMRALLHSRATSPGNHGVARRPFSPHSQTPMSTELSRTSASTSGVAGVTILGPVSPAMTAVLTPDALAFVADLQRRFGDRRAQLLAAKGRDREAAAVLNREPGNAGDPRSLLWQLERGRVNERLGNRADALSAFRRVATMWRNADPEMKPYAEEAQAALERLAREPGR